MSTPVRWRAGAGPLLVGTVVSLGVAGLLVASALGLVPGGGPGAGVAVLVVAVALAAALAVVGRPVIAVVVFLITCYLRLAVSSPLPLSFSTIGLLGVAAATVLAVWRRRHRAVRLGALEVVMFGYAAWNLGSALATHPYPPMDGFSAVRFILAAVIVPFVLYVGARLVLDRERDVRVLLWAIVLLGGYSALVNILQKIAPALVWPQYILSSEFNDRGPGVFNQPVENGLSLIVGWLVCVHLIRRGDLGRRGRLVAWSIALASPVAIYLTHTRGVLLAFAAVLVVGLLYPDLQRWSAVLLTGSGLLIALNWAAFTSTDRESGGIGETSQLDERLNGIATSFHAVLQRPFDGWGIGTFPTINMVMHQQWSQEVRWAYGYGIASHWNELGIMAELGFVGLGLWLAVLVLVVKRQWAAIRILPADGVTGRGLAVAGALSLVAWIAVGTTADLRFFDYANAVVFLVLGLGIGAAERTFAQRRQPAVPAAGTPLAGVTR